MAYFEKRNSKHGIKHRVRIRLKGCPDLQASFDRLTDARKWAQATEAAIREGRYFKTAESRKHTLTALADRYIREVLPTKPKSDVDRERHLDWWKSEIGSYTLADVTPALIAEHRNKLRSGTTLRKTQRSEATVNRYLATLSHAFTIAVKEWGWVDDNPLRKVTKYSESKYARVRFLSDKEREDLLKACKESKNPYLYLVVVLALSTGPRSGEIMWLTWKDINLDRRSILLEETKNGERRTIPLIGRALELMQQYSKIRRIDTDLLFPAKRHPDKPINLRAPWLDALAKANISDFKFHDLRHSSASYLAMNGASPSEIAAVLGHKTLQMVKRYAHLSEAHTTSVVERMNQKMLGW